MKIHVTIPGPPHAQMRPRATRKGHHVSVYEPTASREWKKRAAEWMRAAIGRTKPLAGPISVSIAAHFECPRSKRRKRNPTPAQWSESPKDVDNIAKAVLDAANGILWGDDRQVVDLTIRKIQAAQGDDPRIELQASHAVPMTARQENSP